MPKFTKANLFFVLFFIISIIPLFARITSTVASPSQQEGDIFIYFPMLANHWSASGSFFYVSKAGNNTSGTSWDTAWNELDQIDWAVIGPGDKIFIDGGNSQMVYETALEIERSGTSTKPIIIQLSQEEGHNGTAVFFGGRSIPLPYCHQENYNYQPGDFSYGILTNDHSWIVIEGTKWRGITIHGYKRNGIRIDRHSTDILIRNVEIYDNGFATESQSSSHWVPDEPGVRLGGKNVTIERAIIHDNGQDAIQSLWDDNNIENFTLRHSWLYNGRRHPIVTDESSNYCRHTDGFQIYDGGLIKGINIEESVLGPGFTQLLYLGQTTSASGAAADVQDVTIKNVLFMKGADNGVVAYSGSNSRHWKIDHATFHCPNTKGHCLRIDNPHHSVTNSIFFDAVVTFPDGLNHFQGNCQWQTKGFDIGQTVNPKFVNVTMDAFSLDNYQLQPNSPCSGKGSKITSVQQLLNMPDK